jgi:hypothetical protein
VHAVPASWSANRGIMGKRNHQVRVAVSQARRWVTRRVARSVRLRVAEAGDVWEEDLIRPEAVPVRAVALVLSASV